MRHHRRRPPRRGARHGQSAAAPRNRGTDSIDHHRSSLSGARGTILVRGFARAGTDAGAATVPPDRLPATVPDAPLGDRTSRFDYLSLDPPTGRPFIAMAHSVAVDATTHRSYRPLPDLNNAADIRILEPKSR